MREHAHAGMSLYGSTGARKYLNAAERQRFIETAREAPPVVRLFCYMLRFSGARISEALALTPSSIDMDAGAAIIQTLKRRKPGVIRHVPLPGEFIDELDQVFQLRIRQRDPELATKRIWRWSRTTAWRRVKGVMSVAGIIGTNAMPKGLRHAFGVNAFETNVPPHLVQRWLGHASLRTTGIYGDVVGPEERAFAARMWSATNDLTTDRSRH